MITRSKLPMLSLLLALCLLLSACGGSDRDRRDDPYDNIRDFVEDIEELQKEADAYFDDFFSDG